MSAELAGPESVSSEGGPGNSGSAGPLPAETALGGSGGLADPTAARIAPELLEVLFGSGVSGPGPVGVGIPAAAAAAAAVGDPGESAVSARNRTEHATYLRNLTIILYHIMSCAEQGNRRYGS